MRIEGYVAIFVICLLLESITAGIKKFYWGLILPMLTVIIFYITLNESFYELLVFETLVYIIERLVLKIVRAVKNKNTHKKIDTTKIKDL